MKKIDFYEVTNEYREYLRLKEKKVPSNDYHNHSKFFCGIVLEINGYKYLAPLSSYNKKVTTNMLIFDDDKAISSIRFSFMIPVPNQYLSRISIKDHEDEKYKRLLLKEYNYCNEHADNIRKIANKVYKIGTNKKHPLFNKCCDFTLLEELHDKYLNLTQNEPVSKEAAYAESTND